MDSIRLFLENMFYGIAPSARVTRAKEQLLEMMEDKYYELKEQGLSENETVGRVISEFGNLEEIAEDLGIRNEVFDKEEGEPQERLIVTRERALHYLASMKRVARNVGIGVVICILSGIPFILSQVSGPVAEELGMPIPNFIIGYAMIAIGVMIFIVTGITSDSFEDIEKMPVALDHGTQTQLESQYDTERKAFAIQIAVGVFLCITAFVIITLGATTNLFGTNADVKVLYDVVLGMLPIALGVYLFINAAMRRSSMEALLNRNDYTVEKRRSNQLIERIGGPYWLLATIVYLGWSFLTNDWHITWVVWPIAGICFGLIAAIIGAVYGEKNISKGSN